MKHLFRSPPLCALAAATLSAQQLSSLGSLFDRYTVNPTWAQLPAAMPWGASTSSVTVDGQGRVIALVRAVPYFRMFNADGSFVRAWGDAGLFHLAHSVHVAPDGAIWATDPDDHLVHKFGPDGKIVLTLGKKGVSGDDAVRATPSTSPTPSASAPTARSSCPTAT